MAILKVSVTAEDIEKGTMDSYCCPVALALNRLGYHACVAFSQTKLAPLYEDGVAFWHPKCRVDNPAPIVSFVKRFDGWWLNQDEAPGSKWGKANKPEPENFELEVPDWLVDPNAGVLA